MRPSTQLQYPDLAACLTGMAAERPAGALSFAPCVAGGTDFHARKALT